MRLSEAILLGRHLKQLKAGGAEQWKSDASVGCAIDCALAAAGKTSTWREHEELYEAWPWLQKGAPRPCPFCSWEHGYLTLRGFIGGHLFDQHVMRDRDLTLEQLVDWVRSVEPSELPTEECQSRCEPVSKRECTERVGYPEHSLTDR